MPIRINLLAEAQAAEEQRRRDPVKRAVLVAVGLVFLMLVWGGSLQVKLITYNVRLNGLETKLDSQTNAFQQIQSNQAKLNVINQKLGALHQLATNRFLAANVLNALQQSTQEGIQLMRLRTEQTYIFTEEVKPSKTDTGKSIPGKPATSTERIVVSMEAKDTSPNPGGDLVGKFKNTLAESAYFQNVSISTNDILLKHLDAPVFDNESGKAFVLFSFECRYPEKTR
ncbi:MAG TPA: hypothetical protein VH598_00890 [Verrucomicrobiae bacterium]|jgi:hypothetical protein|nr:hypothetical protein [Verrucomicrobiae bacterium]